MLRPSGRSVATRSSKAAPQRTVAAWSPRTSSISSGAMPAPAQASAQWRSISAARTPRHSSRLAQAISPEMSCGVGRAAASHRRRTRRVHRARREGQGLGGGEADRVRSLHRLAMDTLNERTILRSNSMFFQCDRAWGLNGATLKVRRHGALRRGEPFLVPAAHPQGARRKASRICAFARLSPARRTVRGRPTGAGEGIQTLDPDLGKDVL